MGVFGGGEWHIFVFFGGVLRWVCYTVWRWGFGLWLGVSLPGVDGLGGIGQRRKGHGTVRARDG